MIKPTFLFKIFLEEALVGDKVIFETVLLKNFVENLINKNKITKPTPTINKTMKILKISFAAFDPCFFTLLNVGL